MPDVLRFRVERIDQDLSGPNAALSVRQWHEAQILDFEAIRRSEAVAELSITYEPYRTFRILDSSPAPGVTHSTGEPVDRVYLLSSKPFDPGLLDLTGDVLFTFNGTDVLGTQVSLEDDNYTLKVDLSSLSYASEGTKTLISKTLLTDFEGNTLDEGFDLSWQIESFTNIQAGLRAPPSALGRQGTLKLARISVDHGASLDRMVVQWLTAHRLAERNIVRKVHVPGRGLTSEVFVLYFSSLVPNVVRSFPNSGAVMSSGNVPDRLVLGVDAELSSAIEDQTGVVVFDDTPLDPGYVTITGRTVEVELTGLDAIGHHTMRFRGLETSQGTVRSVPVITSWVFSNHIPTGTGDFNDALYPLLDGTRNFTGPIGGVDAVETGDFPTWGQVLDQIAGSTGGDMLRSVYDPDLDGQVEAADNASALGGVAASGYQLVSQKDAAGGYAGLDADGTVDAQVEFMKAGPLASRPVTGEPGQIYVSNDEAGYCKVYVWVNLP